jgi:hypothetical protein
MDNTDSISKEEPFDKINAWFIGPIRALRSLKNDNEDGAFLAMSAALAMYERFLIKLIQRAGGKTEEEKIKYGGVDLGNIGETNFRIFWNCFRDGLQHQFQPKKITSNDSIYYWDISDKYSEIPEVTIHGPKCSTTNINPWEFAELVNRRYSDNPTFWAAAKSHPPGDILQSADQPNGPQKNVTGQFLAQSSTQSPHNLTPNQKQSVVRLVRIQQ